MPAHAGEAALLRRQAAEQEAAAAAAESQLWGLQAAEQEWRVVDEAFRQTGIVNFVLESVLGDLQVSVCSRAASQVVHFGLSRGLKEGTAVERP